jgi:pimeloyl-ACP methyl ester carboxylesterase
LLIALLGSTVRPLIGAWQPWRASSSPSASSSAGISGGPPDRWVAEHDALRRTPPQPTLYLHGERDGCIDLTLAADAPQHLSAGSRMDVIEHAGHFPHLEHPDLVNKRILAWITA